MMSGVWLRVDILYHLCTTANLRRWGLTSVVRKSDKARQTSKKNTNITCGHDLHRIARVWWKDGGQESGKRKATLYPNLDVPWGRVQLRRIHDHKWGLESSINAEKITYVFPQFRVLWRKHWHMHVHAVYVRPNEQMQLGAERRLSAQPRVGDRISFIRW